MLDIRNIKKSIGQFQLGSFDLQIAAGSYFVLLGPSGSGKSLLLDLISGFEKPDEGKILLNGIDLRKVQPYKRKIGYLFQHVMLFPHLNVAQNIGYAIQSKNMSALQKKENIKQLAENFGIHDLLHRKTTGLSGGEAQRVALARIFASEPEILLLDEPLSGLDVELKSEMIQFFKTLNKKGLTILHVTHDFDEGVRLADTMGIMHNGSLLQTGSPESIAQYPANKFVAHLTGNRNFFPARLITKAQFSEKFAKIGDLEIQLEANFPAGDGCIFFKENKVELYQHKPLSFRTNCFPAEIKHIQKLPFGQEILLDAGMPIFVRQDEKNEHQIRHQIGDKVWLHIEPSDITFMQKQL